jgi:hypothetical protein
MNDVVAAACPTHMFAVYVPHPSPSAKRAPSPSSPSPTSSSTPTAPPSPRSPPPRRSPPVVPLRFLSPEAFAFLHSYLYTQQHALLVAAFAPLCEADLLRLATRAATVHGLWPQRQHARCR